MRIKSLMLFFIFLFTSCLNFTNDSYFFTPRGGESAVFLRAQYISNTSTDLIYETEIVLLNQFTDLGDITFFTKDEFKIEGMGSPKIIDFNRSQPTTKSFPASGIFLIDQSGSYDEIDPYNVRAQLVTKFINDYRSPGDLTIGGFSSDGLITKPLEFFDSQLNDKNDKKQEFVFALAKRTGGTSSLYDAIDKSIDKFSGTSGVRNDLILLIHAPDGGSSATQAVVIQKAKAKGVHIHCIIIGKEVSPESLAALSQQTGGMYAVCPSMDDLITTVNHFERLLNGTAVGYKIRVRTTPGASIQSGFELFHTVTVKDSYDYYHFNPCYVYVKVP